MTVKTRTKTRESSEASLVSVAQIRAAIEQFLASNPGEYNIAAVADAVQQPRAVVAPHLNAMAEADPPTAFMRREGTSKLYSGQPVTIAGESILERKDRIAASKASKPAGNGPDSFAASKVVVHGAAELVIHGVTLIIDTNPATGRRRYTLE